MAHASLRTVIVLAMLLSLACSAIAGRHLLQTSNTRYLATSDASSISGMTGSSILDSNVTVTLQTSSFIFRITGVYGTSPSISSPGYYRSTGALLAELPCTFQAEATSGSWNCTLQEKVTLTSAYQPSGTIKTFVNAGLFTKPSSFYVKVTVNGIVLKGWLSASVTTF
ncbi:unnamed protein product [Closterium sp. Yama58-4]|nr:unnamed protein product [Closterium sp. Yama58-4]